MFDDVSATFHHNVLAAYEEYVAHRDSHSSGRNAHLRTAIAASTALYHFREHLPDSLQPSFSQVLQDCPGYKLINGVANAGKHKSLKNGKPLFKNANDVSELTVVILYQDERGEYSHSQTVIDVKCTDGIIRRLDAEITLVLNYWGELLNSLGVCNFTTRPVPPVLGSSYIALDEATLRFDLLALRGLDFKQKIQLLRFDIEAGCGVPIDLTDAKIVMNIYQSPKQIFDLTMSHPDLGDVTVSIPFSEIENHEYHCLNSDMEREMYMSRFCETHKSEIQKLLTDRLAEKA